HKQKLIDHKDYANSLKNTMILTTDKGPEIFKQKLHQAGIEQKLIDEYAHIYIEEQPLDDIIKVAKKILRQKKGAKIKQKEKLTQTLIQKGYMFDKINIIIEALYLSQSEETLDILLQDELKKTYNKSTKKYSGKKIINKTIETLMRKGYQYDKIKSK